MFNIIKKILKRKKIKEHDFINYSYGFLNSMEVCITTKSKLNLPKLTDCNSIDLGDGLLIGYGKEY